MRRAQYQVVIYEVQLCLSTTALALALALALAFKRKLSGAFKCVN
jgi:hypothetical protein